LLKTLREIQKTVLNPLADFLPPIRGYGFMHTQKNLWISDMRRKASSFCAIVDFFALSFSENCSGPKPAFTAIPNPARIANRTSLEEQPWTGYASSAIVDNYIFRQPLKTVA
jgi:hypothetical protein